LAVELKGWRNAKGGNTLSALHYPLINSRFLRMCV
jgi:hypothetical protein